MKFEQLEGAKEEDFRRLTGIQRATFASMVDLLTQAEQKKKTQGGRPNHLSLENQLLMALEYLREYRTYFHISRSYGISESACYRNIVWIENTLIKDGRFSLPGRKALLKSDTAYEVILVDATESPIERPKKSNAIITPVKRSATR